MTRQMADDEVIGATNFDVLDEVAHDLESWCNAYPPQRFPEPEEADLKWLHATKPGLCDRISASMGRHMVKHMRRMAASVRSIEAKQMAAVAALQAERDALRRDVAKVCADHAAVTRDYDSLGTILRAELTDARSRAERAESALEALRGQVAGLVAAASAHLLQDTRDTFGRLKNELLAIKERMG